MSEFETEIQSGIELYESDLLKVKEIATELQHKFTGKSATPENLLALSNEAVERFRDEAGLEVTVNPWHPSGPSISIDARVAPLDYERQAHEVKQGIAEPFWDAKRKKWGKPNRKRP